MSNKILILVKNYKNIKFYLIKIKIRRNKLFLLANNIINKLTKF